MRIEQLSWTREKGWFVRGSSTQGQGRWDLVLAFAGAELLKNPVILKELRERYPGVPLAGCSTAGEIMDTQVTDDSLVATAVEFKKARIRVAFEKECCNNSSYDAGIKLGEELNSPELVHIFVLATGINVNGSALARGLEEKISSGVKVTGGLAGDGNSFEQTTLVVNGEISQQGVLAIGFYGDDLRVGFGSLGGWDSFGPQRTVSKSEGNIVYQLDNESALGLYTRYLGEYASGLPATGLLFPVCIEAEGKEEIVRTILSVDFKNESITFAGDVPQGSRVRLMKANFDRLIDGASGAARVSHQTLGTSKAELAILISCVGRKMILKQRVEEEVECVRKVLGPEPALLGFYSYGELSPVLSDSACRLHNQTMTITTFSECYE